MSATKPVLQAAIQQYAKQLRLPTLGDQFARLAEEAVKEKQSHLSYLEALLEAEVEERDHRAMARRIQEAPLSGGEDAGGVRLPSCAAYFRGGDEESERGRISDAQGTGHFSG